ncbi:MAG TPA: 5-(carboxyamino)imidazole ribonucleotide mutase, partial [Streptosporangiaceae bacterium]|nr:5-(carboxyamino)imidazole ribonucleotide mutase [Streptosporangiaceae bacterium]
VGGARNAGLLAVRILAVSDPALAERMATFQAELRASAEAKGEALRAKVRVLRAGEQPHPPTGSSAEL